MPYASTHAYHTHARAAGGWPLTYPQAHTALLQVRRNMASHHPARPCYASLHGAYPEVQTDVAAGPRCGRVGVQAQRAGPASQRAQRRGMAWLRTAGACTQRWLRRLVPAPGAAALPWLCSHRQDPAVCLQGLQRVPVGSSSITCVTVQAALPLHVPACKPRQATAGRHPFSAAFTSLRRRRRSQLAHRAQQLLLLPGVGQRAVRTGGMRVWEARPRTLPCTAKPPA